MTAYVGSVHFDESILIGDIVDVRAEVIMTGRTSMHIAVDVSARDPKVQVIRRTTHCVLVFVALDDILKPKPVPALVPENEAQRARWVYADKLKALEMQAQKERSELVELLRSAG